MADRILIGNGSSSYGALTTQLLLRFVPHPWQISLTDHFTLISNSGHHFNIFHRAALHTANVNWLELPAWQSLGNPWDIILWTLNKQETRQKRIFHCSTKFKLPIRVMWARWWNKKPQTFLYLQKQNLNNSTKCLYEHAREQLRESCPQVGHRQEEPHWVQ